MDDEGKSNEHHERPGEYAGERDMDRFWRVAQSIREPFQQRWYIPAVLVLVIVSVPWYRKPGVVGKLIGGLPAWVWTSLLCTVGVSALIAVGVLRFWRDDTESESVDEGPHDDA